jgi:hypothetical protein
MVIVAHRFPATWAVAEGNQHDKAVQTGVELPKHEFKRSWKVSKGVSATRELVHGVSQPMTSSLIRSLIEPQKFCRVV